MVSFQFVDSAGTTWMVVPGLPGDYPDVGESGDEGPLFAGLTFRAGTGELRVLPRAAIPRRVRFPAALPSVGTRSRVSSLEPLDWEELLRHALVWPPA
jgi:hypothetical protein